MILQEAIGQVVLPAGAHSWDLGRFGPSREAYLLCFQEELDKLLPPCFVLLPTLLHASPTLFRVPPHPAPYSSSPYSVLLPILLRAPPNPTPCSSHPAPCSSLPCSVLLPTLLHAPSTVLHVPPTLFMPPSHIAAWQHGSHKQSRDLYLSAPWFWSLEKPKHNNGTGHSLGDFKTMRPGAEDRVEY